MDKSKLFTLVENAGLNRSNDFFKIGIPLPSGQFYDTNDFHIYSSKNQLLPSERTVTACWPDNSIKWCLLKFCTPLQAHENKHIYLRNIDIKPEQSDFDSLILEDPEYITVNTQNCSYYFHKKTFNFIDRATKNDALLFEKGYCRLLNNNNDILIASINEYRYRTAVTEQKPLYSELIINGCFQNPVGSDINFEAILNFNLDSDSIQYSITLHNPERASHPSGIWDLGDINSLLINDFSLGFCIVDDSETLWKSEPTNEWSKLKGSKLNIYQESSGGQNWDSPNHKNKDDIIPMQIKGYICKFEEKIESGDRANPILKLATKNGPIKITIEKFWQNFPRSLTVNKNNVEIGLFPEQFPDCIELQPGEKKTHIFYINFGSHEDDIARAESPVEIIINQDWINKCHVFPHMMDAICNDDIEKIIKESLSGNNNFFVKRETVDEYGWRNFGDLYADHEADLYEGEETFVSHYNNQYDPLYGFIYQYLLTGENKWFQLADDLAKHITDIDLYHTDKDRVEYNGGAFWHTDHYQDAGTSSHRSFSKHHEYLYEGHAGGGGPAEEHCYTTGLLYHYLLTGSEASKQAVLKLSDWITNIYEGSNTFFDFVVGLKRINRRGLKNILTGKYSLDRGTGYYLNALLDKFFLTRDKTVLQQVENIIRNTVHPLDNIDARDLGDAERKWFYTIFLQSVYRYLQTKEEHSELDDDFYYARDSFLHYANWMLKNENPYMEKPEILDFPSHTWTAQDLRKVNILYFSAYYANSQKNEYLKKATQIRKYIVDNLSGESTRSYSRIMAILMQNYISVAALNNDYRKNTFGPVRGYEPLKHVTKISLARNFLTKITQVAFHFSLKKELNWLDKRTQLFTRFKSKK